MTNADVQEGSYGLELPVGSRFGNYEIVRKLGEGGMGAVFEARRQGLNKRVALKVLTLGGSPAVAARFVQEARISASLEHPHVADCFDVGEVDGLPFLALEFLDGETLGARLERGPMGVEEVVDLTLPVCSALATAHQRGVVHRDLKPDNIFLARQLGVVVPKVLDFGIAKARNGNEPQGLTRTASIMGTPGYMSPEQAKDSKNVGPETDQFALGVILWEAVAGRGLFLGESPLDVLMRVVSDPAPALRSLRADVDPAFDAVVARLLDKDAARRFGSMREVGAALLPFASPERRARWAAEFSDASGAGPSHPVTVRDPPLPQSSPATDAPTLAASPSAAPPPPARRRRGVVLAAVVGGAVAVVALVAAVAASRAPGLPAPAPDALHPSALAVTPAAAPSLGSVGPSPSPPTPRAAPAPRPARVEPAADPEPRRGRHPRPERRGRGRRRRPID
ncbi:MAG: serine/threonine-protein kinase [Polyangiales bacterium]